jgi:hypothetical protein
MPRQNGFRQLWRRQEACGKKLYFVADLLET